jgi:hypothetical protein
MTRHTIAVVQAHTPQGDWWVAWTKGVEFRFAQPKQEAVQAVRSIVAERAAHEMEAGSC